jgi:hypothetical protein
VRQAKTLCPGLNLSGHDAGVMLWTIDPINGNDPIIETCVRAPRQKSMQVLHFGIKSRNSWSLFLLSQYERLNLPAIASDRIRPIRESRRSFPFIPIATTFQIIVPVNPFERPCAGQPQGLPFLDDNRLDLVNWQRRQDDAARSRRKCASSCQNFRI